jgi:putative hydrolase of HD superfamily
MMPGPSPGEIEAALDFLRAAEALKSTLRSGQMSSGRQESTAEHTWRLMLMALTFAPAFPEANLSRLLQILLVHDLGEAVSGDIPAVDQAFRPDKAATERAAFVSLLAPLSNEQQRAFLGLYDEYEAAQTLEARLAKGLDKLETILQHTQGANPRGFDHAFNLGYGQAHTLAHPTLAAIRERLDAETRRLAGL